jgi:hypothetical protein
MDTSGLITLKSVVDDFLSENKLDESEFVRLLRIAERGMGELSMFVIPTIKTTTLTIDRRTNAASLPRDYMDYSRIGVIVNGDLYPLSSNSNLQLNKEINCEDTGVPNESSDKFVEDHSYSSRGGHSQFGEYRLNIAKHRIEFDSNASSRQVVLEYISTGVNASEETYVPYMALECMIAWVDWKNSKGDRSLNRVDVQERERIYYNEFEKLKDKYIPSAQELLDAYRSTHKLTV